VLAREPGGYRENGANCDHSAASEVDLRGAEHLVWPECRIDLLVEQRRRTVRERNPAAAADALAQRAQAIGGGGAVPSEAAALAPGRRLAALVQRAFKVPSPCSRAFEVFWAAGSEEESVDPGAAAYGNVVPPPSGRT
jgi:hypothetical protein